MDREMPRNGPIAEEDWRSLALKAERNGFRNGALSVLTVVLIVGAFWVGLQTGPML